MSGFNPEITSSLCGFPTIALHTKIKRRWSSVTPLHAKLTCTENAFKWEYFQKKCHILFPLVNLFICPYPGCDLLCIRLAVK